MIDGNFRQIGNQLVGIAIAVTLAAVGTFILLKLVDTRDGPARLRRA